MSGAFDTLTATKAMEEAGFEREKAEAIAAAIRSGQGELATKADLDASEQRLQIELRWIKTIGGAGFGVTIALLLYIVRMLPA